MTAVSVDRLSLAKAVRPGAVWRNRLSGELVEVVARTGGQLTVKHLAFTPSRRCPSPFFVTTVRNFAIRHDPK